VAPTHAHGRISGTVAVLGVADLLVIATNPLQSGGRSQFLQLLRGWTCRGSSESETTVLSCRVWHRCFTRESLTCHLRLRVQSPHRGDNLTPSFQAERTKTHPPHPCQTLDCPTITQSPTRAPRPSRPAQQRRLELLGHQSEPRAASQTGETLMDA
jgi:hypothetical protein